MEANSSDEMDSNPQVIGSNPITGSDCRSGTAADSIGFVIRIAFLRHASSNLASGSKNFVSFYSLARFLYNRDMTLRYDGEVVYPRQEGPQ